MRAEQPKLYTELAGWWQLVSPTEDYADEAAFFKELFQAENAKTVLELGSGGGNVAWFLKEDFALTLTDISGAMLAESKKQNPRTRTHRGRHANVAPGQDVRRHPDSRRHHVHEQRGGSTRSPAHS